MKDEIFKNIGKKGEEGHDDEKKPREKKRKEEERKGKWRRKNQI